MADPEEAQRQPMRLVAPLAVSDDREAWVRARRWSLTAHGILTPNVLGRSLEELARLRVSRCADDASHAEARAPAAEFVLTGLTRCVSNDHVRVFLLSELPFRTIDIDRMLFDLDKQLDRVLLRLVVTLAARGRCP